MCASIDVTLGIYLAPGTRVATGRVGSSQVSLDIACFSREEASYHERLYFQPEAMIKRHRGSHPEPPHPQTLRPPGGGQISTLRRRKRNFGSSRNKSSYDVLSCFRDPRVVQGALVWMLSITLYVHPDWITAFLQGPKVEQYFPPGVRQATQGEEQPRRTRPEDPRPVSEEIFTAFTGEEKRKLKKMREEFLQEQESGKLIACRLDNGDCQSSVGSISNAVISLLRGPSASSPKRIILRNPLAFHRYICEKAIWGNGGTLVLDGDEISKCLGDDGRPYVFTPGPPPVSGSGMKPIELFWNFDSMIYYDDEYRDNSNVFQTLEFPCPIACRTAGDYELLSVISVKDTRWEILSTMEGEKYYGEAKVKRKSYRRDQFYAVTSFQSDIPLPYFSWAEYHIQHPAVKFDKVIKGASFLANNCDSDSKREDIVLALMETKIRVDSLSGCHNNAKAPPGVDMSNKTAILERYLFHLAFENQRSEDYITEKLWGTLAAGTVPVYFGAPNAKEHVPPNSVIFVDDFASPQDLADYLIRLTKDRALYESFHAWRYKPIDSAFQQKYEFTKTHSTCRICKWAYAKRHGLGWNHTLQSIEEPRISHKTCRNKIGLVGHPFKEYWLTESGENAVAVKSQTSVKTCSLDASNRILEIDDDALQRKIFDHDGVTDLIIDPRSALSVTNRYQLKLETPIATSDLQNIVESLGKEWWLQDTSSRITILTSQPVEMSVVKQGAVQFVVSSPLRVRVIIEDVDTFHKGAKKRANYFGDMMKQDFFSPIEAYKI